MDHFPTISTDEHAIVHSFEFAPGHGSHLVQLDRSKRDRQAPVFMAWPLQFTGRSTSAADGRQTGQT